jgi:serine/threonine-protein kinase
MLAGLRHAHASGVIHRDIKPENVMLIQQQADPDFAKLLDLGIAKLIAPEDAKRTRLTQKGELIGTPVYISPELLRGEDLDARSDLYSLSVMLYEMLASRPPFESSNTMGLFAMHLATPPPPLSEVAPDLDVPAVLERLLQQGLAKEPAARIASAESYQERIDELLRLDWAKAARAAPDGASSQAKRPRVRRSDTSAEPGELQTVRSGSARRFLSDIVRFALRSRSTTVTIVLAVLALAGLCYWIAHDLTFGR